MAEPKRSTDRRKKKKNPKPLLDRGSVSFSRNTFALARGGGRGRGGNTIVRSSSITTIESSPSAPAVGFRNYPLVERICRLVASR